MYVLFSDSCIYASFDYASLLRRRNRLNPRPGPSELRQVDPGAQRHQSLLARASSILPMVPAAGGILQGAFCASALTASRLGLGGSSASALGAGLLGLGGSSASALGGGLLGIGGLSSHLLMVPPGRSCQGVKVGTAITPPEPEEPEARSRWISCCCAHWVAERAPSARRPAVVWGALSFSLAAATPMAAPMAQAH